MLDGISFEPYVWTSVADNGDPKTEFLVDPLVEFEYFTYASKFSDIMGGVKQGSDIEKAYSSIQGEDLRQMLVKFLKDKVKEIRNIRMNGKVVTMKKGEVNISAIPSDVAIEMLAAALSKVIVTKEEEKN